MNNQRPTAGSFCGRARREFLWQTGAGFTGLALLGLLEKDGFFTKECRADGVAQAAAHASETQASAPKPSHFTPQAKSVIFLYMYGGPSHIDTFDYKPAMIGKDGQTIEVKTHGRQGFRNQGRIVEPRWKFHQYGQSGQWVSDLFPHIATCVDDIAFVKSMTADSPIHGSAMLQMNTGKIQSGSPSLGSWINYGLGTLNQDLPGFVVMLDPRGGPISGAKNWQSGYMPATFQATLMRTRGEPILDLAPPADIGPSMQRQLLDTLAQFNTEHRASRADNSSLQARIDSYELAYRMQSAAPTATGLEEESAATLEMYGLNDPNSKVFGRQCLLARRLVERGVRFVQLYSGGAHNDDNWDAHTDMEMNHNRHAAETDRPIAGLLKDLKQRGLLDSTLVVWGGEFGRQPTAEYGKGSGRDHNATGFTMWLAGGGIRGGQSVGATDELGTNAVEDRCHVKHLHATILHQLGIDPNRLSYFHGGLDQKLVGVERVSPIEKLMTKV